ncbi:MAG: hypothetical protein MK102_04575 [Fuerstiella sp.]|nr:hypothetical protein [Fuerstiella sp.]
MIDSTLALSPTSSSAAILAEGLSQVGFFSTPSAAEQSHASNQYRPTPDGVVFPKPMKDLC